MKRFILVIPVIIIVYFFAMWKLNKDYAMIDMPIRILIAAGGSILSGVITFFLMRREAENFVEAHRERKNR
ncbi:hypothetical protein [Bacillus cihuensis]|uniref:hypothetical protein n=1 Tax=Bacillus cihuensis TaxID=1208599 RepID=UPI0004235023|nr:hypothetical protein [Bacillus cihuensis]